MNPTDIVRANFKARQSLQAELRDIDEAATADSRAYTDDESAKVAELRGRLEATDARIQANLDIATRSEEIGSGMDKFLGVLADRDSGEITDSRSIGARFTDTDGYRSVQASGGSGNVNAAHQVFDGLDLRAVTNVTLGAASGGAFVRPALQPRVGELFLDRRTYLIDLLPTINTTDSSIVYVQDQTPLADLANIAVETAEATAKPQGGPTFGVITEPIATIAAWANITRQVAADAPQIQGYLDNRLRYSLKRRADLQVISGAGTGATLTGLTVRSGSVAYAPGSSEARYLSIRHGIRLMEDLETTPEIVVLNPADAEIFDISNAATAGLHAVNSLTDNPSSVGTPTAWGLRQVHSTAIASGTALLIDPMAVTVFDRQQPTAYLTDSHASNFTSNILTLLLEARLGLAVFIPSGVCKITFNGTV